MTTAAGRLSRFPRILPPSSVGGLTGWYRGDDLAGADAAAISQWDDATGNANHATQGTAANQAIKKTSIINSHHVARLTTNDWLSVAGLAPIFSGSDKAFTVIICGKLNGIGANQAMFSAGNSTTTTPRWDIPSFNASNAYRTFKVDDAAANVLVSGLTVDTAAHVISVASPGTKVGLWVDGAVAVAGGTAYDVGTGTYDGVAIGAVYRATPVDFLNGDLAEIVVYNRALSAAERLAVERHLGEKYAVTVA